MFPRLYRLSAAALLALASFSTLSAPAVDADARTLAGLVPSADRSLQAMFDATDATWQRLKERRLASMQEFAKAQFPKEHQACQTLFYPFSGPDALNAVSFFPNCSKYVLFGLEPVGSLPEMASTDSAKAKARLQAMGKAQDYLVRRNFFVTQYMGRDLRSPELNGVVPLMSVMLVRMGYELRGIEFKEVDGSARIASTKQAPRAVQLTFGKPGAADQTLFYANFDASDAGLKAHSSFLTYMQPHSSTVTLLKAASYLLHADEFSTMRKLVLDKSALVVQDDTGVPYKALTDAGFDVKLFGHYAKPIDVFGYRFQKDLSAAYGKLKDQPDLGFEWSYNVKASEMGLQLARKTR